MYRLVHPPADLAPFVRFFWGVTSQGALRARERVIPDGCCELIVHFGMPFGQVGENGGVAVQPRGFVYGQLQRAMVLAPAESTGFVAARFHPAGVAMLFGIDPRALGEAAVPLADLFGREGAEAVERIVEVHTIEEGWGVLVRFLRRAMRPRTPAARTLLAHACALLARPGASVTGAAHELAVSARSVERRFIAGIGLAPRQYSRIARIDAAARLLRSQAGSLAAVAHAAGFADQAHFSREFRALVGVTPGEFLRELGREHAGIVP